MFGLFGDLFDFNHDGKLDSFEKAAEFATFACIMEESRKRRNHDYNDWDDDCDDDDDCF